MELIIAIDGPAGAGKSTIAKELARRLDYLFINTGAMYRAVAWKAINSNIATTDEDSVSAIAEKSVIELIGNIDSMKIIFDSEDITDKISTPEVSREASIISAYSRVRRALVKRQQQMGEGGGVVMEGRDIGTHVFPKANIKIYLDASSDARSQRRFDEDTARGVAVKSFEEMKKEIEERDFRDKSRDDSPLTQADDATYIDSSYMSVDEVVNKIMELVSSFQFPVSS